MGSSSIKNYFHPQQPQQQQQQQLQQQRFKAKKRSSSTSSPTSPNKMTISLLQRCTKVVNYLVSFQESAPFISPMTPPPPKNKIKRPMDFTTLERYLYSQRRYTSYFDFRSDLVLIWENALIIHKDTNNPIHKNAMALKEYYEQMDQFDLDRLPSPSLPVEVIPPKPASPLINDKNRSFYMTLIDLQPQLDHDLNEPLFRFLQQSPPPPPTSPYPRLYIQHHREILKEAASRARASVTSTSTLFAILWDTKLQRLSDHSHWLVTTNVTFTTPLGYVHGIQPDYDYSDDETDDDDDINKNDMAWVKIDPHSVTTFHHVQCVVPSWMEQLYFKHSYTTHRLEAKTETQKEWLDRWLDCLLTGNSNVDVSNLVDSQETIISNDNSNLDDTDDNDYYDGDIDDTELTTTATQDDGILLSTTHSGEKTSTTTLAPSQVYDDDEVYNNAMTVYQQHTTILFDALKKYAQSKNVPIVNIQKYLHHTTAHANAEGYFKQVRYVNNNNNVVVQTFRRMTTSQRMTELVGLLKLKGLANMAEILEVLETTDQQGISGLSMQRYNKTLKQYTHSHTHHRLTAHQKMDLIRQMLQCLQVIHENGIAHRDLSEVNFMVDPKPTKILEDGSVGADVYLIDFGKAVFIRSEDVRRWWIEPVPRRPSTLVDTTATKRMDGGGPRNDDYEGEVIPKTKEELDQWCDHLPLIYVKPDHGYRLYRSIQTLPRNRVDHDVLPWLVDPIAEDMYSIGALIWKVFAETEPWHGVLDSDLKGLRERVDDDERIETHITREVEGDMSRQLLLLCLKTQPNERISAADLLQWIDLPQHATKLLEEWNLHAPMERKRRHRKSGHRFEDEQAKYQQQIDDKRLRKRQKQKINEKQRKIEEKEKAKVERQRKREEARVLQIQKREWERQQLQQQQQQYWQLHQQQQQQLPSIPHHFLPFYPAPAPPPPYGYPGYPSFLPFTQPGGNTYPSFIYGPPPQQQQQQQPSRTFIPSQSASALPPPPPPPPPLPSSSLPPHHIRFKAPVTNVPNTTHPYMVPDNPQPNMLPSPPSSASTPKKRYIPTGRPVGRPKGTTRKQRMEESSSEFEP